MPMMRTSSSASGARQRMPPPSTTRAWYRSTTRDAPKTAPNFIAMEHMPGGTLKERIDKEGPLAPAEAAAIASQVAEALALAHGRGIVTPRHKAPQRAGRRLGGSQGCRLWHSAGGYLKDDDRDKSAPWHRGLHVARARERRACGATERPLLFGGGPLRDANRRASL